MLHYFSRSVVLAIALGAAFLTATAEAKLSSQSKLTLTSIDNIRIGMTTAEASRAGGEPLVGEDDNQNPNCYYVNPKSGPKGVGFMITQGRVARIDVWENPQITTLSGAKIGDSEAQIKALYPGKIQVSPHKYVKGGHYLTFVPKDRNNRNYRVVFETNGKTVTRFRSGKLPEVEYVEGCS